MSNRFKLLGGRKPAPEQLQLGSGVSKVWPFNVVLAVGGRVMEMPPEQAAAFAAGLTAAAINALQIRLGALTRPDEPTTEPSGNGDKPTNAA